MLDALPTADDLAQLPDDVREAFFASLSGLEMDALLHNWDFLARQNQRLPGGEWDNLVFDAGRGFGKTRTGAEIVRIWVKMGYKRLAMIGQDAEDVRKVMVLGESGLLACCWQGDHDASGAWMGVPKYNPSLKTVTWNNGAQVSLYSAEDPEDLRGPQFEKAWCDELGKWKKARDVWDMLAFCMRLGDSPQTVITTTPRPIETLKEIEADPRTVTVRGSTFDNAANLNPRFLERLRERYEGTRLGRQELYAEMLDDVPGALWTWDMINAAKASPKEIEALELDRVVVSVDPSGASDAKSSSDEIGIVVAGRTKEAKPRAVVLADWTLRGSPNEWGKRACHAYHFHGADRLVAERNFGGGMVEHVIRTADSLVAYKEVTASRGKVARAEPVAALYEQGRVLHANLGKDDPQNLDTLEEQMSRMTSREYVGEGSPDRVDAKVWAITDLMLDQGEGIDVW